MGSSVLQVFEDWCKKLTSQMASNNRHILLFLDSASSHICAGLPKTTHDLRIELMILKLRI